MPLTYAVAGVRALIAGGPTDPVVHGVIAMLITTAVSLAVTTLAAHRARIWSIKRLHPSLNVWFPRYGIAKPGHQWIDTIVDYRRSRQPAG